MDTGGAGGTEDDTARSPSPISAARWRVQLLGGFSLDDGRTRLTRLPSRATLLLLVRLVLRPHREHAREELVELLWPGVALDVGRNRLRQALSALKSVLEPPAPAPAPVIEADRRVLRLVPGSVDSDVARFLEALRLGRTLQAQQGYRGELLPGSFEEWILEERRHLEALAEPLLRLPPPVAPAGDAGVERPLGTAASLPRLPQYLTRLIGAENPAAALAERVQAERLVVVRAPGGAGKTRLAVEVAARLARLACFDELVFLALASTRSRDELREAVLSGCSAHGHGTALERLERRFEGARVLLVLDNFEQLVDGGRDDLAQWLAAMPGLHLLVTSRRALGLDGECEFALQPLALPDPGAALQVMAENPAVRLFVDRARAVRADFHLSPRNAPALSAVVRALGGLPLAIELAAARVRSLPVAEMAAWLQPGAGALALLSRAGPRAAGDPRHASMEQVVAWSWSLLEPASRACARMLALLPAGAGAGLLAGQDEPEAWAAARLDDLVSHSVACVLEGRDGASRHALYEPVREWVLAHWPAAERGPSTHRLAEALARAARTRGRGQPDQRALEAEWPNAFAVMDDLIALQRGAAALNLLLELLAGFDDPILPPPALPRLAAVLQALGPDEVEPPVRARAHVLLAESLYEAGEPQQALDHVAAALALPGLGSGPRARVLRAQARLSLRLHGITPEVAPLLDEALALSRQAGDPGTEARLLTLQGVLAIRRDRDYARNLLLKREALARWRTQAHPARVAEGLVNLAIALRGAQHTAERLALLQEAITLTDRIGHHALLAFGLSVRGYAWADARRWDDAQADFLRCIETAWLHHDGREWFYGLWNLPRVLACTGRPAEALRLMAFAQGYFVRRYGPLGWDDLRERRRTRRVARLRLGGAAAGQAWAEGAALTPAEAMALVRRTLDDDAAGRDDPARRAG